MSTLRWSWPDLVAVLYTFLGWGCGVYLLTSGHPVLNAIGVLLTAHALIYSGYLIHECVHHTLFEGGRPNDRLGMLLSWLNGTSIVESADSMPGMVRIRSIIPL